MADDESTISTWAGPAAAQLYANVMMVAAGPFDVTMVFGHHDHADALRRVPQEVVTSEVVRVAMSWAHLKSMIPLLVRVVADYETKLGQIPAPGFDQDWKQ
jgi:hypothetical protein